MAYLSDNQRVFITEEMIRHGSVVKTQHAFRREERVRYTEEISLKYDLQDF